MTHCRWRRGGGRAAEGVILQALAWACAGVLACGPSGTRTPLVGVDLASGGRSGAGGRTGAGQSAGGSGGLDPDPGGAAGTGEDAAAGSGGVGASGEPGGSGSGGDAGSAVDAGPVADLVGPAETSGGPPRVDVAPETGVQDAKPTPPDGAVKDGPAADNPPEGPPLGSSLGMGLISHWSLDEGTGTSAADSVGGNTGALTNGPVWVKPGFAAKSKAALHFDGADDFVELGVRGLPANNKAQTVAFWFRIAAPPSANNAGLVVSLTNGTTSNARLKIGLHGAMAAAWKSAGDNLVATAIPSVNAWHHFAYSFDGTTNRLYLDGVEKAKSTTAPDSAPASNARIGAGYNNAENFAGDVDELRIYGRAITAAEALALSMGAE